MNSNEKVTSEAFWEIFMTTIASEVHCDKIEKAVHHFFVKVSKGQIEHSISSQFQTISNQIHLHVMAGKKVVCIMRHRHSVCPGRASERASGEQRCGGPA